MTKIYITFAVLVLFCTASCSQTNQTDNTTHNADTMVIKENNTDTAVNIISTDTTKR